MIELFFLFSLKHFICDFPLQAHPYLYGNKGKYGHPGGLIHAGIHGLVQDHETYCVIGSRSSQS